MILAEEFHLLSMLHASAVNGGVSKDVNGGMRVFFIDKI
jgi:hypothetical protein